MRRLHTIVLLGAGLAACGSRTGLRADAPPDVTALDLGGPEVDASGVDRADEAPRPDAFAVQPNASCESATALPPGLAADLAVDTTGGRDRVSACEVPVLRGGPVLYYRVRLQEGEQVTFSSEYLIPLPYARIFRDCTRASCLAQSRVGGPGGFMSYSNPGPTADFVVAVGFDYGTIVEVPAGLLQMRVTYQGGPFVAAPCRTAVPLTLGAWSTLDTLPAAALPADTPRVCEGMTVVPAVPYAIASVRVPPGQTLLVETPRGQGALVRLARSCSLECLDASLEQVGWNNRSGSEVLVDILVGVPSRSSPSRIEVRARLL